ncbi:MAG: DinB family protein [Chloroflexi bacterium]|nr:DinB family protein [Chloroflexota bacterium]MDA1002242.1 DinB family protein [Chloroflexota bacterium]
MTSAPALIATLSAARDVLLAAIEGLTAEELLRAPPGPATDTDERWPIRDVLWHIGMYEDYLRRWVDGTRRGIAVEPYAARRRPMHMETPELLRAWLDQTRRPTIVLVGKLGAADLDAARADAAGHETTFALALGALAAHDRAHAEQVRALRATAEHAEPAD